MTDYGTIKIPREDYERHNDRRKGLGLSWLEYIDGEAPVRNDTEPTIPDDIRDALATLEERTGRIEQTLENLGGQY